MDHKNRAFWLWYSGKQGPIFHATNVQYIIGLYKSRELFLVSPLGLSKDVCWLTDKLQEQRQSYTQWTSPTIQNELLEIMSDVVLREVTIDVKASQQFSIIDDETAEKGRE